MQISEITILTNDISINFFLFYMQNSEVMIFCQKKSEIMILANHILGKTVRLRY